MMDDAELLQVKSTVNVSSSYYYTNMSLGPDIEYMDDGSYTMKYKTFSPSSEISRRSRRGESSRAEDFKTSIRSRYRNITVENVDMCMPKLKGNICMFSGGGDHVIYRGSVDTWHGTPDSRVRGAEVLLSSRICYEDEDDIRANSSGDESIVSDGTTANIEGKVTAKDANLAQVVGTCVISSFTEKSVHPEQSPLVPSFLVDKDKFRVVLYNCEKDLLLISDQKLLSTNGYLSQSSMAFLWIMINHR